MTLAVTSSSPQAFSMEFPLWGVSAHVTVRLRGRNADPMLAAETLTAVRHWLVEAEARFSAARPDSEVAQLQRGQLASAERSPELRELVDAVSWLQRDTGGAFRPWNPDGVYDASGYIKGWSIQRAIRLLQQRGIRDAAIGVGDDIAVVGSASEDSPWELTVAYRGTNGEGRAGAGSSSTPERAALVLTPGCRHTGMAVAVSGDHARGDHIWLPAQGPQGTPGRPASLVVVVGEDAGLADAYATAVWAIAGTQGVPAALEWVEDRPGFGAALLPRSGPMVTTSGLDRYICRPQASPVPSQGAARLPLHGDDGAAPVR